MDIAIILIALAKDLVEILRDGKDDAEACKQRVLARLQRAVEDVAGLAAVQDARWDAVEEEPTKP